MVSGFWVNQDGLPLQFGTQKPIPELGGDYLVFGETREVETYISLGATSFGANALQVPALPSSFVGTSTPIAAGIQSMTTLVQLQTTAPVTVASSGGILTVTNPQLAWESVEVECLVSANAGSGGATGISVGLVGMQQSGATSQFVQITPNAGTQILNSWLNAQMVTGAKTTIYPDGTIVGTVKGSSVVGDWIGNTTKGMQIPLVTNALTPLPNNAWISAIAAGGTYSGSSGGGLLKLRLRYTVYGTITV